MRPVAETLQRIPSGHLTGVQMNSHLPRAIAVPVAVAVTIGSVTATASPAASSQGREITDPRIQTFLWQTLPKGPGGTVVAARDGRLVHCRGFGLADREKKIPAHCDTAYDIMSITKQFTAAAILKLEMMGRLRVTDPISRYVGPVPPKKRTITLHHVLTHTSGLGEGGDDYEPVSRDVMLKRALTSTLLADPGEEFHYSNLGYSVLAAIVEKVSGIPYERFLVRYLFAPSGMKYTGYVLPRWKPGQVAVEYDRHGKRQGRPFEHPWAKDGPYWYLRGNGGILSTPRDMFRWHRALEGDTILSRRAKRKMFTPHVRESDQGGIEHYYGYGWGILPKTDDGRLAAHTGGNDWSFGVLARFLDRRVAIFWVTNHAYQDRRWNLEDLAWKLSLGIARRAGA